jgi:hypothetical protein
VILSGKKKPVMGVTGFLFPLLETLRKMKSEKVRYNEEATSYNMYNAHFPKKVPEKIFFSHFPDWQFDGSSVTYVFLFWLTRMDG